MIDVRRIGPRATAQAGSRPHHFRTIRRRTGVADAIALTAAVVYAGGLVHLVDTQWEAGAFTGHTTLSTPVMVALELTMLVGLLIQVRLLTQRSQLDPVSVILHPRVLWIGAGVLAIALLPLVASIAGDIGLAQRP